MIDYAACPLTTPAIGPNALSVQHAVFIRKHVQKTDYKVKKFPFAVQRYVYVAENKDDALNAAEQKVLIHAKWQAICGNPSLP